MSALQGKRIVVTRSRRQSAALVEKLETLGADPIVFPTIEIAPQAENPVLDQALAQLEQYDWLIFTSRNGVEVFWEAFQRRFPGAELARHCGCKIAAIGPATAAALAERGAAANLVPAEYVAEAILAAIGEVRGLHILLPRAEIARAVLVEELQKRGAQVDEIAVYRTLVASPDADAWRQLRAGFDAITFTSSSTVRNFFTLLGDDARGLLDGAVTACIGPITAETLQEYGCRPQVVAQEFTTGGLVQALAAHFQA